MGSTLGEKKNSLPRTYNQFIHQIHWYMVSYYAMEDNRKDLKDPISQ